ncbi:MAG: PhoX family protein [Limisphaerales bacterium]
MSFQDQVTEQAMRGINDSPNDSIQEVLARRFSRREMLRNTLAGVPALVLTTSALTGNVASAFGRTLPNARPSGLGFSPISLTRQDDVVVPDGYAYQLLIGWGDPIFTSSPELNLNSQNGATQAGQFGYNCDFIGYFGLPHYDSQNPNRAILAVNHEYTDPLLMFPGYVPGSPSRDQVDAEIAAHGMSFVEVQSSGLEGWAYVQDSKWNRRITGESLCEVTGPAAGHPLMRTSEDVSGRWVRGTLNNCAGGKTPWGTVLTCEENFNQYFANRNGLPAGEIKTAHTRYGLTTGRSSRRWEDTYSRFDLVKEPTEPFRFGWVVEIDPYNPNSVPKKRTALGRFKHEGATTVVSKDGRVVVYSGDDERFDYIYKFVTADSFNPANRAANLDLLDNGTLYVARFNDDGTGEWLPIVQGYGPLTAANGFPTQGDVLINTRRAADLLGATKMDRPEDIEANPVTGKVYSLMTNNTSRTLAQVDAANPRANNIWGHVIEQTEAGGDHAALTFTWEIFIKCGDPSVPAHDTYFAGYDPSQVSPISAPDNLVFDGAGNCWIATDGLQNGLPAGNDGMFAVPVEGPERGYLRQFMSCPLEAEVCGPEFNPNFTTLFVAIQHPGEGSRSTNPADLLSTWPDGGVPRPAVVAIIKTASGSPRIGS